MPPPQGQLMPIPRAAFSKNLPAKRVPITDYFTLSFLISLRNPGAANDAYDLASELMKTGLDELGRAKGYKLREQLRQWTVVSGVNAEMVEAVAGWPMFDESKKMVRDAAGEHEGQEEGESGGVVRKHDDDAGEADIDVMDGNGQKLEPAVLEAAKWAHDLAKWEPTDATKRFSSVAELKQLYHQMKMSREEVVPAGPGFGQLAMGKTGGRQERIEEIRKELQTLRRHVLFAKRIRELGIKSKT